MDGNRGQKVKQQVVGLIPAAGQATRIAPLPCSKEIYPVGFESEHDGQEEIRPKVVCQYLLEKMRLAGIKKAFIIHLMLGLPFGVPYTLDQAYPFVQDAIVALGYPDTLFGSDDAFGQLLTRQAASADDLVLGIFPADRPQKVDMVDIGDDGQIRQIVIKPRQTHLRYKWAIAVWTPVFTHFMHQYLTNLQTPEETQREVQIGEVFQAAIDSNLRVRGVHVSDEPLLDIGTADDLLRAVRRFISDQK
jgi:glucose-1-phosphate thymidylyltransferase